MFYENFDRLCKERGTSPSAAVVAIGKARTLSAGWKKNHTIPKENELKALAEHLGCNVSDFFKSSEELDMVTDRADYKAMKDAGAPEGAFAEDGNVAEFVKIYNRCNTRQKNVLMNAVFDFEDKVLNAGQDFC